jgi:hypothetical protein
VTFPERAFSRSASPSHAIHAFIVTLPLALVLIGGVDLQVRYTTAVVESGSVQHGFASIEGIVRAAVARPGKALAEWLPGALVVAFVTWARVRERRLWNVMAIAATGAVACEMATFLALRGCGTAMPEIWLASARKTLALVVVLPLVYHGIDAMAPPPDAAAEPTSRRSELIALVVVIALAAGFGGALRGARDGRARTPVAARSRGDAAFRLIRSGEGTSAVDSFVLWGSIGFTTTTLQRVYGEIPVYFKPRAAQTSPAQTQLDIKLYRLPEGDRGALMVDRFTIVRFEDSAPDPPFAQAPAPYPDDVLVLLAIQDWLNRNAPGWHVVTDDPKKSPPSDPAALDIIIKEAEKAGSAYFRDRP